MFGVWCGKSLFRVFAISFSHSFANTTPRSPKGMPYALTIIVFQNRYFSISPTRPFAHSFYRLFAFSLSRNFANATPRSPKGTPYALTIIVFQNCYFSISPFRPLALSFYHPFVNINNNPTPHSTPSIPLVLFLLNAHTIDARWQPAHIQCPIHRILQDHVSYRQ